MCILLYLAQGLPRDRVLRNQLEGIIIFRDILLLKGIIKVNIRVDKLLGSLSQVTL